MQRDPVYTDLDIAMLILLGCAVAIWYMPTIYRRLWQPDSTMTPFERECNEVSIFWMTWLKENAEDFSTAKRYSQNAAAILKENEDPTLLFYGNLIIYTGIIVGLLIIIIGGTKLTTLLINYKLIVLDNRLLTRVNFFKKSVVNRLNYIKKNNLVDYNQKFYEIMIKRIDEFSKTEFWNFDTDEQFKEIRNDLAGFQLALSDSNDFFLYNDIVLLIRAFYKKVEVNKFKIQAAAQLKSAVANTSVKK